MRAAADVGSTPSSGRLRVGPDLSLPSSGRLRAATEISWPLEEEARSSGTRAVAAAVGQAETAARSGTMLHTHTPTVLLVDRDMAVLSTYRRYLQSDQLKVEYALSGAAALRRILSDDPPDVAVCHAFMSDLSGMDLYRRAISAALNWRQRMVLTADVQLPSSMGAFAEFKGQLLTKPVSADALKSAVRACLERTLASHAGRASAT